MISDITVEKINSMSYVDFISLLRETNRCPGGKNTIRKVLQLTHVNSRTKVLEIGSNTGFTSLEIARVAKCKTVGIDVVENAVAESQRVLSLDTKQIQDLVEFKVGSAYDIPFELESFDLLVAGGATSFMEDKLSALNEYHRVLRPWGFLSITNLCYLNQPPQKVVDDVSDIIGVKIHPWNSKDWLELFKNQDIFELYYSENNTLAARSEEDLDEYVEYFIKKPHIAILSKESQDAIRKRWRKIIGVFNENHKYLGFVLAIFRKRALEEEPELFITND